LLLRSGGDAPPAVPVAPLSDLGDAAAGGSASNIPREPSQDPSVAFAEQLEQARRNRPPRVAPEPAATTYPRAGREGGASGGVPSSRTAVNSGMATLPSLDEVRLSGKIPLPEMHIDLHVYSAAPERRFVSINGRKYRQRDTLTDGPTVREITPEGVILDYQGTAFVLIK
jgi:general secretion pathway protein B